MYSVHLPVERQPVPPVLGSVEPVPHVGGTCIALAPPGSAEEPGTAPWGSLGSQRPLLFSETSIVPQGQVPSSDCTPANPEKPG